ncbi:MAG: hypothetical protein ACTTH0_01195 [Eubacteriales bacterium]
MNMNALSMARNFYSAFKINEKANLFGGMPNANFESLSGTGRQSAHDLQAIAKKFQNFQDNKEKIREQYKELVKSKDFNAKDFFGHNANRIHPENSKSIESSKLNAALENVSKSTSEFNIATNNFLSTIEKSTDVANSANKPNPKDLQKAASSFVSAYNKTVDAVAKSGDSNVMSKGISMMSLSSTNKSQLSKIGISIGNSGKLSLDEDKLAQSKAKDLKQLADDKYSYLRRVQNSAKNINNVVQGNKQKTYSNVGSSSFSMANTLGLGNFVNYTA